MNGWRTYQHDESKIVVDIPNAHVIEQFNEHKHNTRLHLFNNEEEKKEDMFDMNKLSSYIYKVDFVDSSIRINSTNNQNNYDIV